jgi:CheY-like chemotaxis protein
MQDVVERISTILVADDEPGIRDVIKSMLSDESYHLIFAENGAEAVDKAHDIIPDLVLLDIMMPKMDGYEVCRHLKSDPLTRDIPVVMLTASNDPQLNRKAFNAGAIACLTKPYRRATLINCVDMALGSSLRLRGRLS